MKIVILLATLVLSFKAFADEPYKADPCKRDFQFRMCSKFNKDADRVSCFEENESKFSKKCLKVLKAVRKVNKDDICKADIKKHCSKLKREYYPLMECLKEKAAELSPECKKQGSF